MHPYEINVRCHRRPNLLDDDFEYKSYIGRDVLSNLFCHQKIDEKTTHIELWFPERWLNIIQERSLFIRLDKYYPNLKSIKIDTQSVYILQCVSKNDIRIIMGADEIAWQEAGHTLPQESVDKKTSFKIPSGNFSQLQTFTG